MLATVAWTAAVLILAPSAGSDQGQQIGEQTVQRIRLTVGEDGQPDRILEGFAVASSSRDQLALVTLSGALEVVSWENVEELENVGIMDPYLIAD